MEVPGPHPRFPSVITEMEKCCGWQAGGGATFSSPPPRTTSAQPRPTELLLETGRGR